MGWREGAEERGGEGAPEARGAPSFWPAACGAARQMLGTGTSLRVCEELSSCSACGMSFQNMVGCVWAQKKDLESLILQSPTWSSFQEESYSWGLENSLGAPGGAQ